LSFGLANPGLRRIGHATTRIDAIILPSIASPLAFGANTWPKSANAIRTMCWWG